MLNAESDSAKYKAPSSSIRLKPRSRTLRAVSRFSSFANSFAPSRVILLLERKINIQWKRHVLIKYLSGSPFLCIFHSKSPKSWYEPVQSTGLLFLLKFVSFFFSVQQHKMHSAFSTLVYPSSCDTWSPNTPVFTEYIWGALATANICLQMLRTRYTYLS